MGYIFWLIIVWLVAEAFNFIHWRFRVADELQFFPVSGVPGAMNVTILLAVLSSAILFLAGIVPATPFVFLIFGHLITVNMYSVWIRHRQRRTCACGEALKSAPAMQFFEATWFPFQSPEVREICANLTAAERVQLLTYVRQFVMGMYRECRISMILGIAVVWVWVAFSWRVGIVLLASLVIYWSVFIWPRLRAMRPWSKELLCETEWARSRGYTPERLELMKLPCTRGGK